MGYPKKPVVLVVDDTIANIRILDDLLRGEYTVRVATNGATALRLALSEPRPDIVLLDIMMPDMDGYEVCRRLKSDPLTSNIAVVFITAMGNEEHEAKGLDLGAVDFIAKPFQPRLVRARVSNHVALKKYNDELNSLVKERTKELYLSRSVTVECLASVVETRDNETGAHVRRTQHGVEILAKRLRLMRPDIWDDDDDTIEPSTTKPPGTSSWKAAGHSLIRLSSKLFCLKRTRSARSSSHIPTTKTPCSSPTTDTLPSHRHTAGRLLQCVPALQPLRCGQRH